MDSEQIQEWLSLGGATVAIVIGLVSPEAGMLTVGLGALSVPGMLRLAFQRGSTKVRVEAQV